jgi:hypothetical protein
MANKFPQTKLTAAHKLLGIMSRDSYEPILKLLKSFDPAFFLPKAEALLLADSTRQCIET